MYFPSCLCRLPVVSEQELLRSIHQELPLERINGATPAQHSPQQRAQFANNKRVQAVLKRLKDAGTEVFVEPEGVNLDNVKTLLDVVTDWLVLATDIQNPHCLHRQNHDVWGGMLLTPEEARKIVAMAVAKTAMRLKFLNLYREFQDMRAVYSVSPRLKNSLYCWVELSVIRPCLTLLLFVFVG